VQIFDVAAEVGELSVLADRNSERAVIFDRLDYAI
jgi:hypothetical protein